MGLDVDVPEPPDLSNRGAPSGYSHLEDVAGTEDFRREELETMLRNGAWRDGFEEWAEYADLDADEIRVVADLGLFRRLDFYWDPVEETLGYDAPSVPDDWRDRVPESLSSTSQASRVEAELDDLGRTVFEELQDTYLDWNDDVSGYVWDDETEE